MSDLAEEVHAWVDAHWDTASTVRAWWRSLADAGYAHPSWPEGCGDLAYAIVGAHGLLDGVESPLGGDLQRVGLASPGTRIGGGTDEIQLNVLGEQALGLPREPGDDRDVPYRDLLR